MVDSPAHTHTFMLNGRLVLSPHAKQSLFLGHFLRGKGGHLVGGGLRRGLWRGSRPLASLHWGCLATLHRGCLATLHWGSLPL